MGAGSTTSHCDLIFCLDLSRGLDLKSETNGFVGVIGFSGEVIGFSGEVIDDKQFGWYKG